MPRYKEYDRDRVLQNAMKVFWKRGYEGSSMQSLVEATGLNRFSMYEAFGSKEGLFLAVLDRYREKITQRATEALLQEPLGLDRIRNFFDGLIQNCSQSRNTKGCLMTNTAIDCQARGKEATAKVKKQFEGMEQAFFQNLERAREQGEIDRNADLKDLARYFLGITQSIAVFSRVYSEPDQIQSLVRVAFLNIAEK